MPLCIAIADDNVDWQEMLALLMRLDGHVVHCESEGHAALRCLEQNQPDAAILDIGMPGLTGPEIVAAARAQPWGGHIVFIAVSGYGDKRSIEAAKRAGFDHYLIKPIDPEILYGIVRRIVPGRRIK
jgi:CheY-like chemotaxis protein